MKKSIFSIIVLVLSWTAYGDNHQNISLSWTPSFVFPEKSFTLSTNEFRFIGGSLEYIRHNNSFKWGIGLEYPSHRSDLVAFLSLRGEWIFQQKNNWQASFGAKIGGGILYSPMEGITLPTFYAAPTTSFEYLFNTTFSGFISLNVPFNLGVITIGDSIWNIEIPIGIRFYF